MAYDAEGKWVSDSYLQSVNANQGNTGYFTGGLTGQSGGVNTGYNFAQNLPTAQTASLASMPAEMGTWGTQGLSLDGSTSGLGGVSGIGGMGANSFDSIDFGGQNYGLTGAGTGGNSGGGMGFLSTDKQQGWGGLALQGAGALASSWLGLQNLGVAKDQLAFQRDAFERNFAEQKANQDKYYSDRTAARAAAQQ